jgi:hypothetical protein
MSLTLTIASVAVIAAGVTLTVHQSKINRVRSDKAKMMQETMELAQERAEDEQKRYEYTELANLVSALSSKREQEAIEAREAKRARQSEEIKQMLDDMMQQYEESRFDMEAYSKHRAEFWGSWHKSSQVQ